MITGTCCLVALIAIPAIASIGYAGNKTLENFDTRAEALDSEGSLDP